MLYNGINQRLNLEYADSGVVSTDKYWVFHGRKNNKTSDLDFKMEILTLCNSLA